MTEHKFTDEEIMQYMLVYADRMCNRCEVKDSICCGSCFISRIKDGVDLINRQKAEIERMKAGKVCSIGDKLYIILEDETAPGGWGIEINNVTEVGERFIFYSGYYPPRDDILNNVSIEDIGKDVFLDEAEFRRELERRRLAHDV